MSKWVFFLLLLPLFAFSQISNKNKIYYAYENHPEFSYLKNIDIVVKEIYNSINLNGLNFQFKYLEEDSLKTSNSIITNYGLNTKVKFIFQDDNLSYLTKERFNKFRRGFYQNKDLIVFVFLDSKNTINKKLKNIDFENFNIGVLMDKNFVSTTYFDPIQERFLKFYFYFQNHQLIKTEITELNSQFSWDITNNSSYYFKNDSVIFKHFNQTLMDGRFSLDPKYDSEYLLNLSYKILRKLNIHETN